MEVTDLLARDAGFLLEPFALGFQPLPDQILGRQDVKQISGILRALNGCNSAHLSAPVLTCLEFQIDLTGNFRFQLYPCAKPYACALWCQARITVATVRWKVRLVGQFLTGLVCFSLPTCLPTNTSPHWMTSERSIRCLSCFATRSAAAAPRSFAACCQNAAA